MKRGFNLLKSDLKAWWKGILLGLALWAAFSLLLGTPCWFTWVLGIPCPFCGMTRAGIQLLCGDVAGAWSFQPMLFPTLFALALLVASRYVNRKLLPIAIVVAGVCFFGCIAFYLWKMATVYPNAAPYVYTEKNLLHLF